MCGLGVPIALQHGAIMISKLVVHSYVNSYGVVASAVNAVGGKINSCAMIVSQALATAGTSMIGQNFGAGKFGRIRRVVYTSLGVGLVFSWSLALLMIFFPEQIFGLFTDDAEVLAMSHSFVIIAVLSFNGFALRSPMNALINGTGNARLSLVIGLLDGVVARIGFSILLGVTLQFGIMGFWMGDVLASQIPFFVGGVYFWTGIWKKRRPVVERSRAEELA